MQRADESVEPIPLHRAEKPATEKPVGGLLSDLARQFSLLLRQEIALARAEVTAKLGQIGSGTGLIGAAALIAFSGFLTLLAAATLGLAKFVDLWLAALIVGAVVMVLAGILAMVGRARLKADALVPRRTVRSLKDDAEWAREQMR